MIYSVWSQSGRRFDYYEAPGQLDRANADRPGHIRHRPMGASPTEAAWPLPVGARLVGSGSSARGRIAIGRRAAMGLSDFDRNTVGIVGLGLAALILLRVLRPRRR